MNNTISKIMIGNKWVKGKSFLTALERGVVTVFLGCQHVTNGGYWDAVDSYMCLKKRDICEIGLGGERETNKPRNGANQKTSDDNFFVWPNKKRGDALSLNEK
jgi:hypothetical protein